MASAEGMETHAARLDTFGTTRHGRKGSPKGFESQDWPHMQPTGEQLAQAGFYFDPTPVSPDNVTCYICKKSLDGWEPEDDPVQEHATFSPDCGIAIHALIEQQVEAGIRDHENPMSERMAEARKSTFRDMWPHEKKRGWTCKTQKMVDGGWYYCPTPESDDYAKCAYCNLGLDGWDPKDKPFEEHQNRSPECQFFVLGQPPVKPKGRSKKSQASKASRASAISIASTVEDITMEDTTTLDESVMITSANGAKAKKPAKTTRGRAKSKASMTAPVATLTSSFLEPEDDDFEVKIATPQKASRGKKRKSEDIEDESHLSQAPAAKRRGNRTRSSTVRPEVTPIEEPYATTDVDMVESEIAPKAPAAKKGRAVGRPRGSIAARKASQKSHAARSSNATSIADADLEAALGNDLDASVIEPEPQPTQPPAKRGRAASKTQKKKATPAVTAADYETHPEVRPIEQSTTELSMVTADESIHSVAPINNPKQRNTRGGKRTVSKAVVEIHVDESDREPIAAEVADSAQQDVREEPLPPKGKGRQASRTVSRKVSKAKPKKAEAMPEPEASAYVEAAAVEDTVIFQPAPTEQAAVEEEEAPKPKRGRKPGTTNKNRKTKTSAANQSADETAVPQDDGSVIESTARHIQAELLEDEIVEAPAPKRQASTAKATRKVSAKTKTTKKAAPKSEPIVEPEVEAEPQPTLPERHHTPEPTNFVEPESPFEPQLESEATPVAPTPEKQRSAAGQQFPSPTPSPQPSDAENQPPSSRPSATRPPLAPLSPLAAVRVPLQQAASTPQAQRTGENATLATSFAWDGVDIDAIFAASPGKENGMSSKALANMTCPEKNMTVEEWVMWNSEQAQERLRAECERVVGRFESEGVRALKALEGVVTID